MMHKKIISKFRSFIIERIVQLPGWHTNKKIILFESDDWGMIRMASKEAYNSFLKKGYLVDQCPYNKYDSLESNQDLEYLYEVLRSARDSRGNPAKFTINNVIGNPDFAKIKDSDFNLYFWEPFTTTLDRINKSEKVIDLYKQGINENIIQPQFHGREHIGIGRWLEALKSGSKHHLEAFDHNMYTVTKTGTISCKGDFLDAFYPESICYQPVESRLKEGLIEFERIWGFSSESIIAPCYTWNNQIESALFDSNIKFIQGARAQKIPLIEQQRIDVQYNFTGRKNSLGQLYLIRNVEFEPALDYKIDHVDHAMCQINLAFKFRKPAIISTHRVNYTGSIHPENRKNGLIQLKSLLIQIIKKWPDVVFMSTDELGHLILN